jgi:hypothetical protein
MAVVVSQGVLSAGQVYLRTTAAVVHTETWRSVALFLCLSSGVEG